MLNKQVKSQNSWRFRLFRLKVISLIYFTGLYRVNYDTQNWKLLIAQLHTNPNAISIENRGQLINDAWNLARASMLTYDYAFNLSNYLRFNEQEFLPWQAFKNTMDFMYNMYSRLPAEFGHFKVNTIYPGYQAESWQKK